MNIFKRLFNIGKAEAHSIKETTKLIEEAEGELVNQKLKLKALQVSDAKEAIILAQQIEKWESLVQSAKKNNLNPESLSGALDRDHDGSIMDNLGGLMGNAGSSSGTPILGKKKEPIEDTTNLEDLDLDKETLDL